MVSPSKTGAGNLTSSQPRFAITFWETSGTRWPGTRGAGREEVVSPSEAGAGNLPSSQPRFAITFWETSVTLWPVTSATVNVESTRGRPNSVWAAEWRGGGGGAGEG